MDSNGENKVRLSDKNFWDEDPKWSPDGSMIAFLSVEPNGNYEIYVIDSDGKTD